MRPTPPSPGSPLPARPAPWRTTGLLSLLALGVASPLAVLTLLGASAAVGQTARLGLAPGVHHEGVAVAAAEGPAAAASAAASTAAHGLALRRGCLWGQPGRQPYQGSVRQALQAAGLPEDVIAQIEAQRREGRKSGRLAISRSGIRHTGDGRVFPARGIALTYGMTLCQDARVNFAGGHVEMADLYEARDAQGKPHAVMVPDVCGNVSVLGAAGSRGGRGVVAGVAATLSQRAQALVALAEALDPRVGGGWVAGADGAFAADPAGAVGAGGDGGRGAAAAGVAGEAEGAGGGEAGAAAGASAGGSAVGWAADGAGARSPADPASQANPADGLSPAPGQPVTAGGAAAAPATGGGAVPTQVDTPAPFKLLAGVTGLLVPPTAAAAVARGVAGVAAAAGRGLATLAPAADSGSTGRGAGGGHGSGGATGAGASLQVPEPGSLALSGLALGLLVWRLWRRRD